MTFLNTPPPDGFWLGSIRIYYYSLCLLAAVWAAYWLAIKRLTPKPLSREKVTDLILILLMTGILGGRFGYVIQNIDYYSQQPMEIWQLSSGGLSIHGAIAAGLIALWVYAKRKGLQFFDLTDRLAIPVLAGQLLGRFGNFFNQELFGYPTQLPWKIFIDPAHRPPGYFTDSFFHPTFLYEIILNGIGLFVIARLSLKKPGQLTGAYFIIFGTSRFVTEIFRISDRLIGPLSVAQLISLALVGVGIWLIKSATKAQSTSRRSSAA